MEDLILLKHQMTFDKGAKTIQWEKGHPFSRNAGKPEYPHAKD